MRIARAILERSYTNFMSFIAHKNNLNFLKKEFSFEDKNLHILLYSIKWCFLSFL